eukprot:TRINITY_DN19797_c0_g1_i2.p1 TRINITY_DN19797_c0_g1~~TRINITY_DN19797_c0_g1_i2.p1  ORF type:complete len:976 (-),score=119.87 TRINITY_DN19797_c0_g1_i2:59-2986(-)
MRCVVKQLMKNGKFVSSGVVCGDTKVNFKSRSTTMYWLFQMSLEMWQYNEDGDLNMYHAINNLVTEITAQWREETHTHCVCVLFIARVLNEDGKSHQDYFKVVKMINTHTDWAKIGLQLRQHFTAFSQALGVAWPHDQATGPKPTTGRRLSSAKDGNVLEAINMILNCFAHHHVDRNLLHTGQVIVVITAGCGIWRVSPRLAYLTQQRISDIGISCNVICLGAPPLHVVPLFEFSTQPEDDGEHYHHPTWMTLHYFCRYDTPFPVLLTLQKGTTMVKFNDRTENEFLAQCRANSLLTQSLAQGPLTASLASALPPPALATTNISTYDDGVFNTIAPIVNLKSGTLPVQPVQFQGTNLPFANEPDAPAGFQRKLKNPQRTVQEKNDSHIILSTTHPFHPVGPVESTSVNSIALSRRWIHAALRPLTEVENIVGASMNDWSFISDVALMPITCDYFPSAEALREDQYSEHAPYTIVPNEDAYHGDNVVQLLREVVMQRLQEGYQLIPHANARPAEACDVRMGTEIYYLGLGHQFHVVWVDASECLNVKRYQLLPKLQADLARMRLEHQRASDALRAAEKSGRDVEKARRQVAEATAELEGLREKLDVPYQYESWNNLLEKWEPRKMWFRDEMANFHMNWNQKDSCIAGDDAHFQLNHKELGFRKQRLLLIAAEPIEATRIRSHFERFKADLGRMNTFKFREPLLVDILDDDNVEFTSWTEPGQSANASRVAPGFRRVRMEFTQHLDRKYQWFDLECSAQFHVLTAFQMELRWLACSGNIVAELLHAFRRRAQASGLLLVQIPSDPAPYSSHPFRSKATITVPQSYVRTLILKALMAPPHNYRPNRSLVGLGTLFINGTGIGMMECVPQGFVWFNNFANFTGSITIGQSNAEVKGHLATVQHLCDVYIEAHTLVTAIISAACDAAEAGIAAHAASIPPNERIDVSLLISRSLDAHSMQLAEAAAPDEANAWEDGYVCF